MTMLLGFWKGSEFISVQATWRLGDLAVLEAGNEIYSED